MQGAGNVGTVAVRTNHVGVKAHQVTGFYAPECGFLHPGIDSRTGSEHAAVVPVSVVGKVGVVE